jgi:glycosyltransferase involved in cell wall biosynthesis
VTPITVSHFGGLQAFPLARALHFAGALQLLYTGLYFRSASARRLFHFAPKTKDYMLDLPAEKIRIPSASFLFHKAANIVLPQSMRLAAMRHFIDTFDVAVAADIRRRGAGDTFVGFELSSVESFRVATDLGRACVLEASSIHFSSQLPLVRGTPLFEHVQRTADRKAREIGLARKIVVLSKAASESYIRGGVEPAKLVVIAPYVDSVSTEPKKMAGKRRPGVNFLFVGNLGFHKGVDLLLEAFSRFSDSGKRLRIVGGHAGGSKATNVEWIPRIPKSQLKPHFDWADFLVLPSRFDGFGLVVGEAMLHGLPVIVSDAVGAADYVRHRENGWVFPSGDTEALTEALREAAACENWESMSVAAHRDATPLRFDAYTQRVVEFYRTVQTDSAELQLEGNN